MEDEEIHPGLPAPGEGEGQDDDDVTQQDHGEEHWQEYDLFCPTIISNYNFGGVLDC